MLRSTQELFHNKGMAVVALVALAALSGPAHAESYPARPVRLVVPYAAGGAVDVIARVLGASMGTLLGQTVVVEDKPGGSANIGAEYVAKAPADGYTLLLGSVGLTTNGALFSNLGYDTLRDFAPVERVGYAPLVFVVDAASPAKSLKDLIAMARAKPGALTYGSSGNGSSAHLAGELLKSMAGIDLVHVPYKGGAPAMTDLLGGRLSFMANNPIEVIPHIRSGKLRALAVGGRERLPLLPDVPTVAEQGLPGYEATVWWGVLAPAHTPPAIVKTLSDDAAKALNDPDVRKKLADAGAVISPEGPDAFGTFLRGEIAKWTRVIQSSGIRPE